METRSKTRAGLTQVPPEGVLEDPELRSPVDVDEHLGLTTLLGDGEVPIVGGDQPEVGARGGATTSGLGDIPVVSEWAPARKPVVEPSRPQPTTPTLVLAESAAAIVSLH